MQYNGRRAHQTYAQCYHFVNGLTKALAFDQNRHYTPSLAIRTIRPQLPRQGNCTDCGIFTRIYQQILSKRYGDAAVHHFTADRIAHHITDLKVVTQSKVTDHRTWLRCTIQTWWPHIGQNGNL
jgi:Ulp1 family protease